MIEELFDWVTANQEWFFSGVGTAVLIALVGWMVGRRQLKSTMNQTGGAGSKNIQVAGNLNVSQSKGDEE